MRSAGSKQPCAKSVPGRVCVGAPTALLHVFSTHWEMRCEYELIPYLVNPIPYYNRVVKVSYHLLVKLQERTVYS